MTSTLLHHASNTDLAGTWSTDLPLLQVAQRVCRLTQHFITPTHLQERLEELPQQFQNPQPRRWAYIAWSAIGPDQVSGIPVELFCRILSGTINTEAPIRSYTQASRQYLEHAYPEMAHFVGGTVDASGKVIRMGLWEREEKRHTPALITLFTHLAGHRPELVPHPARPYTPSSDLRDDLYRHGLHRIATEYGAACLYLWMMAYTTGPLQAVLAELLIDEVNHMAKFWGFGRWAYPQVGLGQLSWTLTKAMVRKMRQHNLQGSLVHTLRRMMGELGWPEWGISHRLTLLYTFDQVMRVLWQWDRTVNRDYLESLFWQVGGQK